MPTGETMSEGSDMPDKNTITLGKAALGGMDAKEGDKITFCVTGMDGEDVMGYFEPMKDSKSGGGDDWESMARKELSPRDGDTEQAM